MPWLRSARLSAMRPYLFVAALLASSGCGAAVRAETFSAPTGDLGADLDLDPERRARLHGEMSYHTAGVDPFLNLPGTQYHYLMWTFGAGFKVSDQLELEVTLPVGGVALSNNLGSRDSFGAANLTLGLNYFSALGRAVRLKVGGALAFGPWNDSSGALTEEGTALTLAGLSTHGYQNLWQYQAGAVHLVAPARVELGDTVQLTGDASMHLMVPTLGNGADARLIVVLAPGVAFWTSDTVVLGARMPLQFVSNNDGPQMIVPDNDGFQMSLEPFIRVALGEKGFLGSRFTMHFDEPLGFSFDTGGFWGLHLAAGASF